MINPNNEAVVVVIRDKVADNCSAPMLFSNDACAVRYFNTKIVDNKSDYEMIKLGTYDSVNCDIKLINKVILVKGE